MSIRESLEPLELLDLNKCDSVGSLVNAMSRCSFGARMLGEVAHTLFDWIREENRPVIIYDGGINTPLYSVLSLMVQHKWFSDVMLPEKHRYAMGMTGRNALIIGSYSSRHEDSICSKAKRSIFINEFGMAPKGTTKDGYFPDAIFADPSFVMPVLYHTLQEKMGVKKTSVAELMAVLPPFGGLALEVSEGAQTLHSMVTDPTCDLFMTISGAMTIAKMSLLICEMIDRGMVQYISSTGALMAHGLIESIGLKHYKYNPAHDDTLLASERLNRVTDTLEPEENFTHIAEILNSILDGIDEKAPLSSWILHQKIGKFLHENYPHERGILKSAYEKNVPIVVPAFIDSEMGNDVYVHNRDRERKRRSPLVMNMELDSKKLFEMAITAKRIGIFSIGGGVPRNNTQNVSPLIDIYNERLGSSLLPKKFVHGCRIAPDKPYYGHLSGCTYNENKSWRKMETAGIFSEIHGDATQIWPFVLKYVIEKIENK